MDANPDSWSKAGPAAVISGLLVWLVTTFLPRSHRAENLRIDRLMREARAEMEREREAARAERAEFMAAMERMEKRHHESTERLAQSIDKLTEQMNALVKAA